jgi:hypothetical protein
VRSEIITNWDSRIIMEGGRHLFEGTIADFVWKD